MTIAELREWLAKFPQDAEVYCIEHTSGTTYYDQGGNITFEKFDPSEASSDNKWSQCWELYTPTSGPSTFTFGQSY